MLLQITGWRDSPGAAQLDLALCARDSDSARAIPGQSLPPKRDLICRSTQQQSPTPFNKEQNSVFERVEKCTWRINKKPGYWEVTGLLNKTTGRELLAVASFYITVETEEHLLPGLFPP